MRKMTLVAGFIGLLAALPVSASLVVNESSVSSNNFWKYTYTLSESGTSASYTDFLLSTADLSPTNVTFNFDNSGADSWTWLDYSATQVDFYNSGTGSLNLGDSLVISFTSFLPPGAQALQGFNINTGASSNVVNTSGPTATPEPGTLSTLALGLAFLAIGIRRKILRPIVRV
jgi:hypothetical protein